MLRYKNGQKNYGNKEFEWIPNIITNYTDSECARDPNQVNNTNIKKLLLVFKMMTFVGNNYTEITYNSVNPLKKLQILIWDNVIQEITDVETQKSWTYKGNIIIPSTTTGREVINWL